MGEQQLLEHLKNEEQAAFDELYRRYYTMALNHIRKNSGTTNDAEDIFQEALLVLVKQLRKPDFQLTSKLGTFLQSIIRNLWLNELRKRKQTTSIENGELDFPDENLLPEKELQERRHQLIQKVFKNLKQDCKALLDAYYFKKQSLGIIADKMGYTGNFIKVKKHRCMNGFKSLIEQDQDFKQLIEQESYE